MSYPKKVYALFPYDEQGNIAGVYVGSSWKPKERVRIHKNTPNGKGKQDRLHALMRTNGFSYLIIDEIPTCNDTYIEFDWIDFFIKRTKLPVFNNFVGACGANWERIKTRGEPV